MEAVEEARERFPCFILDKAIRMWSHPYAHYFIGALPELFLTCKLTGKSALKISDFQYTSPADCFRMLFAASKNGSVVRFKFLVIINAIFYFLQGIKSQRDHSM